MDNPFYLKWAWLGSWIPLNWGSYLPLRTASFEVPLDTVLSLPDWDYVTFERSPAVPSRYDQIY